MNVFAPAAAELLVVGAGPVGLFAALSAARAGIDTTVIDHQYRGFGRGYAALLHPSTLRLLTEAGVPERALAAGRELSRVGLRVDGSERVVLELPAPAVALSQSALEQALLAALRATDVRILSPCEGGVLREDASGVEVRVVRRELVTLGSPGEYSDWQPVESFPLRAAFVIGADGYESRVRNALGIDVMKLGETESFAMFELAADPLPSSALELSFSDSLSAAMLPLAGGRARFGFQLATGLDEPPTAARLSALLRERTPWFDPSVRAVDWSSTIHFERRLARRFGQGRIWLAGDAAHVTSPLGAHSVNLGLAEAGDLVRRVAACLHDGAELASLREYGSERQREWHKLLGYNVKFELLEHAPRWLRAYAPRIAPVLPASGRELKHLLEQLGLKIS
jgi:2-polyprenyl-6-methoxyphenol hydroxylase-like FAD-dependent oxidoreductase